MGGQLSLTGLKAHTHTAAAGDGGGALAPATLDATGACSFAADVLISGDARLNLANSATTMKLNFLRTGHPDVGLYRGGANALEFYTGNEGTGAATTGLFYIPTSKAHLTRSGTLDGVSLPALPEFYVDTDVTASRALNGTVYQNTLARPILVTIAITPNAQAYTVTVHCDAANPPTVVSGLLSNDTAGGNYTGSISFIVPAGHYYKATTTGTAPASFSWIEWS